MSTAAIVRSRPIIASANRKRTQPRTFNVDTAICLNHMSAHQKIEWRLGTEAPFFKRSHGGNMGILRLPCEGGYRTMVYGRIVLLEKLPKKQLAPRDGGAIS